VQAIFLPRHLKKSKKSRFSRLKNAKYVFSNADPFVLVRLLLHGQHRRRRLLCSAQLLLLLRLPPSHALRLHLLSKHHRMIRLFISFIILSLVTHNKRIRVLRDRNSINREITATVVAVYSTKPVQFNV